MIACGVSFKRGGFFNTKNGGMIIRAKLELIMQEKMINFRQRGLKTKWIKLIKKHMKLHVRYLILYVCIIDVAKAKLIEFLDARDMPLDSFFKIADSDRDNKISSNEFRSLLEPIKAANLNVNEIDRLFDMLDKDSSNAISMM